MSLPEKLQEMQRIAHTKTDFHPETSATLHNDLYQYVLKNKDKGYGIIEIGCYRGASSIVLSYICKELGWPFYTIDIDLKSIEFTKKLLIDLDLADCVTFYTGTMEKFIVEYKLERNPLLVFVDADHSYDGVRNDIKHIKKFNKLPYAIAFHDFSLRSYKYKNIMVDKAIFDSFGHDIEYSRIGIQFDSNPLPSADKPSETGSYWDYNGCEGILIETNTLWHEDNCFTYNYSTDRRLGMLKVKDFLNDKTVYCFGDAPETPAVTVCMPIYCHNGPLLKRAITSVLNQSFANFEFIIVDDGSRDGSFETALEYTKRDPRITLIRHKYNCGLPAVRINEAILLAKGKYIAYQFDDDEWLEDSLKLRVEELEKHDEPCVVYGKAVLTNPNTANGKSYLGGEFNYLKLRNGNYIANVSIIHHKSIFNISGLYDPNVCMRRCCDWELWIRMAQYFNFYFLDELTSYVESDRKGSLGGTIHIFDHGYMYKYVQNNTPDNLLPSNILEYDVCHIHDCFTMKEKDAFSRRDIFPFLQKNTYFFQDKFFPFISRDKKLNILLIRPTYDASTEIVLNNYIKTNLPVTMSYVPSETCCKLSLIDFDAVIFFKAVTECNLKFMHFLKELKIPTIYIADDNMLKLYEIDKYRDFGPNGPYYSNIANMIKYADLNITYSSIIAEDIRPHNEKITIMSTNIPCEYLVKRPKSKRRKTSFVFTSTMARYDIAKELWSAFVKFADKYGESISMTFFGPINPSVFGELKCETHCVSWSPVYYKYLRELCKHSFDYQICPLDDIFRQYRSKSPIKYLEGTAAGAVGIFTNTLPYSALAEGVCLYADENTVDAWFEALEKALFLDEDDRYKIYEHALDDIRLHWTTENSSVRFMTAYETAILMSRLNNKKIAYVAHEGYLGGATLHIFRHLKLIAEIGVDVIFCLSENQRDQGDIITFAAKSGYTIEYLPLWNHIDVSTPLNRCAGDYECAKKITDWALKHNVGMFCSVTNMPALGIAAETLGIPNVVTLHQFYKPNELVMPSESNIQMIHSSSNRYASEWEDETGVPAIRIVCPVSDEYFSLYADNLAYNLKEHKKVRILVSGTLQERKGQLQAVRAMRLLVDKGYDILLVLIGYSTIGLNSEVDKYAATVDSEIIELGLEENVAMIGFTYEPEKYYAKYCNILLCASTDESMPQTILQAAAAGLFVVSTNCGGVTEIIKDNYNGIITETHTAEGITEGIIRLLSKDDEEKRFMLENAHAMISAIGTEKYVTSELVHLYNRAFDRLNELPRAKIVTNFDKIRAGLLPNPYSRQTSINTTATTATTATPTYYYREYTEDPRYSEYSGGRNLNGKKRRYRIPMHTGILYGQQYIIGALTPVTGRLVFEYYYKGKYSQTVERDISTTEPSSARAFGHSLKTLIRGNNSNDFVEVDVTYISNDPTEYICLWEKKKPSTLLNRLLYKLNTRGSYHLSEKGIYV